jgi:hypothetical protein
MLDVTCWTHTLIIYDDCVIPCTVFCKVSMYIANQVPVLRLVA